PRSRARTGLRAKPAPTPTRSWRTRASLPTRSPRSAPLVWRRAPDRPRSPFPFGGCTVPPAVFPMARTRMPSTSPDQPARRALARTARWYLPRIDALVSSLISDADPESIHRLRGIIRHLRCTLRMLDRCADLPALRRLQDALGTLADDTGAVRDAD